MNKLPPISIIPDTEFRFPGYKSVPVKTALGSFHPGPGVLSFNCKSMRQQLNVQRMMQLYYTGKSPLLTQPGMTSEDIMQQTGVGHELRHFHDWLLSFSYFDAARRRLNLGSNTLLALRELSERQDAYIPLPLLDWITADRTTREAKTAELCDFYNVQSFQLYELPHFTMDRLEDPSSEADYLSELLLISSRAAVAVKALLYGYPQYLRPFDVFELSAVATQLLTIIDRFGVHTAHDIYQTSFASTYYDRVINPIDELLDMDSADGIKGTDVLLLASAMCLWAICAEPKAHPMSPQACPAVRFSTLRSKLLDAKQELKRKCHDIEGLIRYFDRLMGEPALSERIELGTQHFKEEALKTEEGIARYPSRHPYQMTLRYYKKLISLREQLHSKVFEDIYFHVRGAYESDRAYGLTLPAVVINTTNLSAEELATDLGQLLGSETMFRFSDDMNDLKDEINVVHEADRLASKIWFDQDLSLSEAGRNSIMDGIEKLSGGQSISFTWGATS
ncbi:hypothetical protein [Bradyrhizobium japonicum]|uniref:hypothetical protein n=1 Tax=Bradyrhizobium japonicum TaxID=375 RepID=UPI001E4171B7|nr:hypothetical protein [Bradyrhizobium japonicum]MCD9816651.1 hypothetical protein [Bradyrhizobium japonicum]MEB2670312.1 hypothetical protein [Bradyrhizobium japonicum]WRI89663.1 hypothetical protein R3F75_01500 [Bradyrhizobium japonicum]